MSPVLRASERYRLVPLGNDNNNDTKKREYRTKAESLFEHERALLLSFSCPPDHSALSSFLYVFLASEYISPGSKRYCSRDAEIKLSFGDNNGITKSTVTYIKVS
ncbi:hypothetical protein PV325_008943 [Microctonus aethiopoides]|nr:hypothetical protein PV325_008943 [Microctonus aethiopoides]